LKKDVNENLFFTIGKASSMAMSRSENMRCIRSKDTAPELTVRKVLRSMGFTGYRIHQKDLPGKPDIAFISKKKAILIHGCFWHGHDCKEGIRKPKSNLEYWIPKIEKNRQRDEATLEKLKNAGWDVLSVWDCELCNIDWLKERILVFLR
jgi:DNA mismatch endonuclease (patch repair protein)